MPWKPLAQKQRPHPLVLQARSNMPCTFMLDLLGIHSGMERLNLQERDLVQCVRRSQSLEF